MGEALLRSRMRQYKNQVERIVAHDVGAPELFRLNTEHRCSVFADLVGAAPLAPNDTVWVALTADGVEVRTALDVVAVLRNEHAAVARDYAEGQTEVFGSIADVDSELRVCEIFLVRPNVVR